MGEFTFGWIKEDLQLEEIIEGISISNIMFDYDCCGPKKDKITTSDVFLLPVVSIDGSAYGLSEIGDDIAEFPLGFSVKQNFLQTDHYCFNDQGDIIQSDKDEDKLYLPLVKVKDFFESIDWPISDGNSEEVNSSICRIMGLKCDNETYPLVFTGEDEDGQIIKGLVLNDEGILGSYNINPPGEKQWEIYAFLQTKKYGIQEPRQRVANIKTKSKTKNDDINWTEPKPIVEYLDKRVVGHQKAKKVYAVVFSNFMMQVQEGISPIEKDNLLLIGGTGVGKTLMAHLLAEVADVPFIKIKLSGKSTEGYKGENLSSTLYNLVDEEGDEDPYGVVFLDEIDKLANPEESSFGPKLQDELINWLEEADVMQDPDARGASYSVNTRNILFLAAGAFENHQGHSLKEIINKRLNSSKSFIGFDSQGGNQEESEDILSYASPEDLIKYGLKPELVGRFSSVEALHSLTYDEKRTILTNKESTPLKKYHTLLGTKGFKLRVSPPVYDIIVKNSEETTGARALKATCNMLFTDIMFEPEKYSKGKTISITKKVANEIMKSHLGYSS